MINYQINCPFKIGDMVNVIKNVYDENQIECPFCKGESVIDTGLTHWSYDEPLRVASKFYKKDLILTCKNCNGTGIIKYIEPPKKDTKKVKVLGIYQLHSGNWRNIQFCVQYSDGHTENVYGKDIAI